MLRKRRMHQATHTLSIMPPSRRRCMLQASSHMPTPRRRCLLQASTHTEPHATAARRFMLQASRHMPTPRRRCMHQATHTSSHMPPPQRRCMLQTLSCMPLPGRLCMLQATCAPSYMPSLCSDGKPQRQATSASTQQAANMCWFTQKPGAQSGRKGKQKLQAHGNQLNVLAHTRAHHPCKPQRRAPAASTPQAANMCWLLHEPNTPASHKGNQQLQAHR